MVELFEKNQLKGPPDLNYEWNSIVERLNKILLNEE